MRAIPSPSTVVFAALGPNPAPLTELLWQLAQEQASQSYEVHVVVEREARHYLDGELLAPGAALDQLRDVIGPQRIPPITVLEATDAGGDLIEDDAELESREAYTEAVWSGAKRAVEVAGARPLVFGLVAGRRRTMTALQTAVFQLLARPGDRLLDVRVTDPRVEGGTGFFFPAQPQLLVPARHTAEFVEARCVEVILVELDLPRLRALVPPGALTSLKSARQAAARVIQNVAPVHLHLDLHAGQAHADGQHIPLSPSQFVWFAYLCVGMKEGATWIAPNDFEGLRDFLNSLWHLEWWSSKIPQGSIFKRLAADDVRDEADLKEVDVWRSKTMRSLRTFAASWGGGMQAIVPEQRSHKIEGSKARNYHRLSLSPEFIQISGRPR